MTDQEREALRRVEDGPVKRPYLSLIRNRKTWSDLRLADGEQYMVGERVDAVELTPEVRAALAAREEPQEIELPDAVALHNALIWARKSLKTHMDWLSHIQAGHATEDELRLVGDEAGQKECIEEYNALCGVLRRVIDARDSGAWFRASSPNTARIQTPVAAREDTER